MSIIAYKYDGNFYCPSCAALRFGYRCEHAPHDNARDDERGIRFTSDCPMLDENGIPCEPYPVDSNDPPISTISSLEVWCDGGSGGCVLGCSNCLRIIRDHSPSEHDYCDCGDGCDLGDCAACAENEYEPDDPEYEPEERIPEYGCVCEHCEAAARYVLGMDDTQPPAEQLSLPEPAVPHTDWMLDLEPLEVPDFEDGEYWLDSRSYGGSGLACPSSQGAPNYYECERVRGHAGPHGAFGSRVRGALAVIDRATW